MTFARRSVRLAPDESDRRTVACGYAGDHEQCDGLHPGTEVACSCGCHREPWPFEYTPD